MRRKRVPEGKKKKRKHLLAGATLIDDDFLIEDLPRDESKPELT